jgi:hypothetical protein
MSKAIFSLAMVVLCFSVSEANAQPPKVLQSPYVANARACLKQLYDAGRKARFHTDWQGPVILILNPSQKKIHPLLILAAKCLDAAFPKNEVIEHSVTHAKSRVWYAPPIEEQFVWCASNSTTNKIESVERLGGSGNLRRWFGVTVKCDISPKILGWYFPKI